MEAQSLCVPLWIEQTQAMGFFSFSFGETRAIAIDAATSHQTTQQTTWKASQRHDAPSHDAYTS